MDFFKSLFGDLSFQNIFNRSNSPSIKNTVKNSEIHNHFSPEKTKDERIIELEKENKELKEVLAVKDNFVYRPERHSYWSKDGEDGPYCSSCMEVQSRPTHMHPCGNPSYYECPACKTRVEVFPENNVVRNQFTDRPNRSNPAR